MKRYLYRFLWDCGRQGHVEGLFVASELEIEKVIGKTVSFGEILGKHSEIDGVIARDDIEKVDLDSGTVEKVAKILGDTWSGYNPFDYVDYFTNLEWWNYSEHCKKYNKIKAMIRTIRSRLKIK